MATIQFKRGTNLTNLAIADGQFIVNTAERAIYVDVGEERLRIGDFVKVGTLADLPADANPTSLYLVDEINCLCYHNGTSWIQINRDTGAKEFEVTGEGNVITGVAYDATTRKLTLTRGITAMTAADVDAKISDADAAVRAYVDEKTQGIATDAALGELQAKVTAAEQDIDTLQEQVGTGTVTSQIDTKIEALDLANTYEVKGEAAKVSSALNEYKTANDEAVAKVVADLAAEAKRADEAEKANTAAAAAAMTAAGNAQSAVDALKAEVGTPTEGKTVVEMIADAQNAATYDDTAIQQSIADNAAAIAAVKEDVDTFFADADLTENAKDTLKEIQEYIDGDAEAAAAMTASIQKNTQAITAVEGRATTLEGEMDAVETRAGTLEGKMTAVEGKVTTLEGQAHTHTFVETELNKIADGDVAKWNAAEQNAKQYTDDLNDAMSTRVDALEAKDHHTHANKAELDLIESGDKAKWDAAEGKAHEHANKDALDTITADKVAAWDTAKTDAVAEANAHSDDIKTELSAAVTDGDTATLTSAKEFTSSCLEWGTF